MRAILLPAFFINIFLLNIALHYHSISHQVLWTTYQQIKNTLPIVVKEVTQLQAITTTTDNIHKGKKERAVASVSKNWSQHQPQTKAGYNNKVSSEPVELTLEYIALQLPRSHNLK